eukprot:PhM_4_TR419/c6_g1_i1/m.23554
MATASAPSLRFNLFQSEGGTENSSVEPLLIRLLQSHWNEKPMFSLRRAVRQPGWVCAFQTTTTPRRLEGRDALVAAARISPLDGTSRETGVVTFVVVDPEHRGLGLGRALMEAVERCAREEMGYAFLVLCSRPETCPFYDKIGYRPCAVAPTKESDVVKKKLTDAAAEKLLKLFQKGDLDVNDDSNHNNTVKMTWLTKRLIVERPLVPWDARAGWEEDAAQIINLIPLPWRRQVGPTCGPTCVSIVSSALYNCSNNNNNIQPPLASMADIEAYAVTELNVSRFGEMFCVDAMKKVVDRFCCCCCKGSSICDTVAALSQYDVGDGEPALRRTIVIIPYDKDRNNYPSPGLGGRHAHWGIVHGIRCLQREEKEEQEQEKDNVDDDVQFALTQPLAKEVLWVGKTELIDSNAQLFDADISKLGPDAVVGCDGKPNLAGKCVVIRL